MYGENNVSHDHEWYKYKNLADFMAKQRLLMRTDKVDGNQTSMINLF